MNSKKAFTLVELIVVITILIILGTISFISLQGYNKIARNSVRIADISIIEKQLELYDTKVGTLPMPDNYIEIYASGRLIGYQGYTANKVLDLIKVFNGGIDPLNQDYYTYMIDSYRTHYQIMGFLEKGGEISLNTINSTNAEETRTPYVKGNDLGIIIDLENNPIQKILTGSFDIANTTDIYSAYLNNNEIITGTGLELKKASPTYSCKRIMSLRNSETNTYDIDNYYYSGNSQVSVLCDKDFEGGTPIVKSFGGENGDLINALKTDSKGNIYIGGHINGANINFFGETISTTDSTADYFIAKLDENLNLIWYKTGGASGSDSIYDLELDGEGNIYVGGVFEGISTNILGNNITSNGSNDYFLAKLDNDGNTIWLKNGGGENYDYLTNFELDGNGNIIVAGYYKSISGVIFGESVSTKGLNDYFLAKLDNNGNTIWFKNGGGVNGNDYVSTINIDSEGNIYIGGNVGSSVIGTNIFGHEITSLGGYDYYYLKLNSDGGEVWFKNGGGTGYYDYITSSAIDKDGNIYFGGYFNSTLGNLFGETVSTNGENDYFLVKLDNNGNTIWLKNGGGSNGNESIISIFIDTEGYIYTSGYFSNDGNIFGKNINSVGGNDFYYSKLNSTGNIIWLKNGGGSGLDTGNKITLDENGIIYLLGRTNSTEPIDVFGHTVLINGLLDSFIVKLFK